MTEGTIEVTAEVIDEQTAIEPAFTPAVIDAKGYLEDRRAKVTAYMEPYQGMTEESLRELDKREVYDLRADVNKVIKAMKGEVSAIKKEHMKPFDAFKAQADAVIAQAEDAHRLLDKVFKDKEALDRSDRRAQLEEEYLGCVGVLAEVIPFDAVIDEKWLGDTAWKNGKAVNELYDKAAKANEGYQTLQKKELRHKTEVVKFYCETLDLMKALQLEDDLNEEERQREEFERRQREAEAFKAEKQEQRAETEAEAFAPAPEPEPAPEPATAPSPEVFTWALSLEFVGTKERAQALANLLKSEGITGATIKCKGAFNG
ncbi:MAG: DUF1351 domain-containing protein [Eggerthellaceae bacterium]|nr:DUF1351 domain-containing protein [Eggerthellaceae bacterium]